MQTSLPPETSPNCISDVIQKDNALHRICKKTEMIQQANQILANILPVPLNQHCFVGNIDGQVITICTDSAAWGTQLRYQHPTISKTFRNQPHFNHVRFIKIRLMPTRQKPPLKKRQLRMSSSVGSTINESADTVSHPGLKAALQRLAQHAKRP